MTASRYDASGQQAEFEPGSRRRVLRNLLGIVSARDMAEAESQALEIAQEAALERFGPSRRFSAKDVCELHRLRLGPIYPWAGKYRSINIGKGGFQFAHVPMIPQLMREFERGPLRQHTPCSSASASAIARSLAEVHAELILVHPFRDGNGRLARLLALLMALQAGLPPLDFSPLAGRGKRSYIAAIHAAMARDYEPLTRLFLRIIDRSQRRVASSRR
jgi:cell filamentation protein